MADRLVDHALVKRMMGVSTAGLVMEEWRELWSVFHKQQGSDKLDCVVNILNKLVRESLEEKNRFKIIIIIVEK